MQSYQYSEPHSGSHVQFSPDGRLLASAVAYRLLLRDALTLQIVQLYSCVDAIDGLEWSHDSAFVLCIISKRGVAQVWSVSDAEWHCKIDEGPVGLAHARWSPDGRHVLAAADFNLRITIWSLLDRSVYYIRYPKFSREGLDFSRDGSLMVLAERREFRDTINVFECDGWVPLRSFGVATQDLADVKWSPDGSVLCVVDTILQYQVLLYTAAGVHLQTYRPYEHALGVKTYSWSPSGQLLALGSYDEKIRILNNITWQRLAECEHPTALGKDFAPCVVVWHEPTSAGVEESGTLNDFTVDASFEDVADATRDVASSGLAAGYLARQLPIIVPTARPNLDKPNPKVGVGLLLWSAGGHYLATRNDNMPRALWVWDSESFCLHSILLQQQAIRTAVWHPSLQILALCTNSTRIFLWSPRGCHTAPLPQVHGFRVCAMSWSPEGNILLLLDRERFCLCFIELPADVEP
uniref:Anaphase-promoting complex subunit 4 WD40 domain-containing protein n=1 Tax=Haptolina ericina TaxID=156174 RepID=A0A7S3AL99_9EUKA|mmetsp:Transcript_21915/g.49429  ORF Transcript_21915/g.49429 Transcript_21915/m.49429 type:complete len:465 (+) Transcript_21915:63-1457(+)|eukprot:CAMPEP_0181199956 /NCGR_PEP_ID=MMETSP1096-20121128/17478_1 /TAXON_ID=156174 ORGANISM="Chrysochromulina ericina, Strain CCMP281" /NCGR_SAMPLE_ID=MMETSP1096 /ASSEMBLY_ACC=CAM_ASM_000453 /LENGTH=464 /DNA_ID=CAMNT_0023290223 /DNA_START=85 /DNA_END=1482 /DNA_ORIENTATION=+